MNREFSAMKTIIGVFAAVMFASGFAFAEGDSLMAPAGVKAMAGDSGAITLSWDAVKGAESYNIYMASKAGVLMKSYKSMPDAMTHRSMSNSFTHPGPSGGKIYYFVITAVGPGVESGESAEVSAPAAGSQEKKTRRGGWLY